MLPDLRNIPWTIYREIIANVPVACVDVAIFNSGKVLLVERLDAPARGQLWLPGGRVFKGEMLRDAAFRKAQQEVGIACHVGPMIHVAETIFEDGPDGIAVHSINICFFLFPVQNGIEVRLDQHHAEHRWVDTIDEGLHGYIKDCLRRTGLATFAPKP